MIGWVPSTIMGENGIKTSEESKYAMRYWMHWED